jgi:hypothetical protein
MRKWKRRMVGGERETRMKGGIIPRRRKMIAKSTFRNEKN